MLRLATLVCLLAAATAFRCVPKSFCTPEKCGPEPTNCPAGVGYVNVCECCKECLLAEGEDCGGAYQGSPKCGSGLECVKPPLKKDEIAWNQDGKCVKKTVTVPEYV